MITPKMIMEAEENGISYHTLYMRLKRGWDAERATTETTERKTLKKEFEIAEKNGIGKGTVETRIRLYGWDTEKAITEPTQKETNEFYKHLEIALKNGISKTTFYSRVNKLGWELERASTQKPRKIKRKSEEGK